VNSRRPVRALCLAGLTAALPPPGLAQAAGGGVGAGAVAAPASAPQPSTAPTAKLSPLLSQVLNRVGSGSREGQAAEAGLFKRLARQNPPASAADEAQAPGALTPALGYAMEQLDPASFAVLRPIAVGGSGALLRTGDVFVLQFSTNLPGLVRLENIDSRGRVADLGTYTVLVDTLNRLPRDRGIQLQGQPGLERLRFYFYPCMPPEAAGKPWAADFEQRLPPCYGAAARQTADGGGYGVVSPRAMENLTQPDAHLAFAGIRNYQPGEVTLMEARIRHEGPVHGR
jgi:hypothetical protein